MECANRIAIQWDGEEETMGFWGTLVSNRPRDLYKPAKTPQNSCYDVYIPSIQKCVHAFFEILCKVVAQHVHPNLPLDHSTCSDHKGGIVQVSKRCRGSIEQVSDIGPATCRGMHPNDRLHSQTSGCLGLAPCAEHLPANSVATVTPQQSRESCRKGR